MERQHKTEATSKTPHLTVRSWRTLCAWTQAALLVAALALTSVVPVAAQGSPDADLADTATEAVVPAVGANTLYIPTASRDACLGQKDSEMPIGVQMYGNTGPSSPFFPALRQSQASWMRVAIEWRTVQPTQGQFNWREADSAVAAAAHGCMNVIVTLEGTADWATTSGSRAPIKQTMLGDYATYVQAVVERYDGDGFKDAPNGAVVELFEFYNEPDFVTADGTFFGWGNNGARYAEMLKTVYPKVKAANPNAQVVMGGIAYEWFYPEDKDDTSNGLFDRNFLDNVLANGGGAYFDIMNFHCYPFPKNCRSWAEGESSGLVEKIEAIRAKLAQYNLDKPMVITELGWHSDANDIYPSTDDLQGRYLVQLLTQALAHDVDVVIWWTLVNPQPLGPGEPGYPYDTGLFTNSPTVEEKPVFRVFEEYRSRMGYAQFVSIHSGVNDEDQLEAYRFRDPATNKIFYVAWTNSVEGSNSTTTLIDGKRATLYNKQGVQISVKNDADDGTTDSKVSVQVGSDPIYIVVD